MFDRASCTLRLPRLNFSVSEIEALLAGETALCSAQHHSPRTSFLPAPAAPVRPHRSIGASPGPLPRPPSAPGPAERGREQASKQASSAFPSPPGVPRAPARKVLRLACAPSPAQPSRVGRPSVLRRPKQHDRTWLGSRSELRRAPAPAARVLGRGEGRPRETAHAAKRGAAPAPIARGQRRVTAARPPGQLRATGGRARSPQRRACLAGRERGGLSKPPGPGEKRRES